MKKILSTVLLTGLVFASTASAFAAEEPNLPYVEGLGYEVELLETNPNQPALRSYDSGWKNFLGGNWRHGVGTRYVWSKYDHKRKIHNTTVQGAGGKRSYSGWTNPKIRALASWEKAWSGNLAWANVK